MTTPLTARQRIRLLVKCVHPLVPPREEMEAIVQSQLGHLEALERWVPSAAHGTGHYRVIPPKMIYHICADNLAVSSINSLILGLILDADNIVKLPSPRENSSTRAEITGFIRLLHPIFRRKIKIQYDINHDLLSQADVVVAFGSDKTMSELRAKIRWNQKFIAHGHAVSLLWIENPGLFNRNQARAAAIDVLTYDQLGCLSPQAIYVSDEPQIERIGDLLAEALEYHWSSQPNHPERTLMINARVREARDLAYAAGNRVWIPPGESHFGWTVIHDPDPTFKLSPLHGVVYLRKARPRHLQRALAPVQGKISSVGLVGKISPEAEAAFLELGVTRLCQASRMQMPPLTWHHDGMVALAQMVTWVDRHIVAKGL